MVLSLDPRLTSSAPVSFATDAGELAYLAPDGQALVHRRLVDPAQRVLLGMLPPASDTSGGQFVAVAYPEPGSGQTRADLVVQDLSSCSLTKSPISFANGPAPSSTEILVGAAVFGQRLFAAIEPYPYMTRYPATSVLTGDLSTGTKATVFSGSPSYSVAFDGTLAVMHVFTPAPTGQPDPASEAVKWADVASGASGRVPSLPCPGALLPRRMAVDGTRVAWAGQASDGRCHIFVLDTATGSVTQATSGASDQWAPALRGQLLAYLDDRAGAAEVWAVRLDSGTTSLLVNQPGAYGPPFVLPVGVAWTQPDVSAPSYDLIAWNPTVKP